MTASARDGRDGPFSDWLRRNPSIDSRDHSIYACDIDMMFYKYRTVVDKVGTRDLKLTMDVEIKTFGAYPNEEQRELLFFKHQLNVKKKMYSTMLSRAVKVWHFGQFVLRILDGDRPDNCTSMNWGRFSERGRLEEVSVDETMLAGILRFDIAPDTLDKLELSTRRHHKTTWTYYTDKSGLFPVERPVASRS